MNNHFFKIGLCAIALYVATTMVAQNTDTLLIAEAKGDFELPPASLQRSIPLQLRNEPLGNNIYYLMLDGVQVSMFPEGVYEVFLSTVPGQKRRRMLPESPGFVGLINLFGLEPGKPGNIALEVSTVARRLLQGKRKGGVLYSIVQFRGNTLPNGREVKHTARLRCQRVRLVKIRG
jgi:hypothetical protein